MAKSIFISKPESEVQGLKTQLTISGSILVAHSFLNFEPVDFEIKQDFEIIFFSSPRAVIFFKARYDIPKNVLIACTGVKTSSLLNSLGYEVTFSSEKPGQINQFSKEFKSWCKQRTVLFPISSISLKTISSLFPEKQKSEVIVYKTTVNGKTLNPCDTYIFTSPSNVQGFLIKNLISKDARVISWGESTSKELKANGVKITNELKTASIKEASLILGLE